VSASTVNARTVTHSRWLATTTLSLAIAGTGVATYLTVAHFTSHDLLACSGQGFVDCAKVTTSEQSRVFGIPVAVLGLVWWIVMLALCLPISWRASSPLVHRARLWVAAAGVAFVLWLLYAEFVILHSICLWCSVVHVLVFAEFVLIAMYGLEPADTVPSR
jgi:uncharacterized membrane protein